MNHKTYPNLRDVWDFKNPEASRQSFQAMLEEYPLDEHHGFHLEIQTQVARTFGLERSFDRAHDLLNQVKSEMKPHEKRIEIRYFLERGRTFNSSGEKEKARDHFLKAYELSRDKKEDFLEVDAAHMMGIVETGTTSLEWNEIAIKTAERSDDVHARNWLGSLYNNTGWTYHDMGEFERAHELFEDALAFRIEQKNPGDIRIAKWCVARAERSLGNIEKALGMQLSLLDEYNELGSSDGYVFEEIAECYYALGKMDEAKPYFKKAYDELSKDSWMLEHEAERMNRLKELGN